MRIAGIMPLGPQRRAFTLIETLVVIAIIVIIVGLTAAGYFYWIGATQKRNTEANMRTVYKVFQTQWNFVIDQAKKETPSPNVLTAAGNDPARAKVLWTKIRLIEAFPCTYAEINNNAAGTDAVYLLLAAAIPSSQRRNVATYQRVTKGLQAANSSATESAACLLMALAVGRGGAALSVDDLGGAVFDSDGDGVPELVDGWRQSMYFYRFAWNMPGAVPDIQGQNPAPTGSKGDKLADPLDPAGALFTWPPVPPPAAPFNTARGAYEAYAHRIAIPASYTNAFYVIPVLVSAGTDGKLDLPLPNQVNIAGLTKSGNGETDNIYSFNLR